MDINAIIQNVIAFTQGNIIVTVIVGIFTLFLLIRYPKILLTIVLIIIAGYGLAEFFDQLRDKAKI